MNFLKRCLGIASVIAYGALFLFYTIILFPLVFPLLILPIGICTVIVDKIVRHFNRARPSPKTQKYEKTTDEIIIKKQMYPILLKEKPAKTQTITRSLSDCFHNRSFSITKFILLRRYSAPNLLTKIKPDEPSSFRLRA